MRMPKAVEHRVRPSHGQEAGDLEDVAHVLRAAHEPPARLQLLDRVWRRVVDPDLGREPDAARLQAPAVDHDHRRSIAVAGEPLRRCHGLDLDRPAASRRRACRQRGRRARRSHSARRWRSTGRGGGPRALHVSIRRPRPDHVPERRGVEVRGDRPGSRLRSSTPAAPPSTVGRERSRHSTSFRAVHADDEVGAEEGAGLLAQHRTRCR